MPIDDLDKEPVKQWMADTIQGLIGDLVYDPDPGPIEKRYGNVHLTMIRIASVIRIEVWSH